MIIYTVMECARNSDRLRCAFVKEKDAEAERDRLDKAMPNSDGFYVESLKVEE